MAKKKSSLAELVRSEYGTREPKYSIKKAVPNTPVKGKRDFSVRVSDGPSASEIGKSVLGVVKNAPAGIVPTAQMLGQGLLDLGKFSAKNAYLGLKDRFTGGDEQMQNFAATDFAKSLAANPGRVVAENAPVIGGALSVSDLMGNAIAARRAGDEATASRLEGLVVPMLAAGLVPGGKAAASAERGLLREGVQAAEKAAVGNVGRALEGAETPFMVSTRRPTPPNYATQGNPDERLLVQTGEALKAAPAAFEKNMGLLSEEPFMRGVENASPEGIYREGVRRGADNLKFIMNELMPTEQVSAAKEWYPTAQMVSERAAGRAGLPPQAGYGVTAVTSPQTPWDINVARLDRLMDMYGDKFSVNPAEAQRWAQGRLASKAPGAVAGRGEEYVSRIASTPFEELQDPFDRFSRVVMADATRNNPSVPRINLSGEYGEPYGPITWGSSTEINKALNILEDPTMETINAQLLGGGKVPSFYNNIANPYSAAPITTIDTHSAGAASLFPGGGKDPIVYRAMGLGRPTPSHPAAASDVARTGAKGLYGPLSDMHTLAGQEMSMLPREVQSATWEGVRDLWGQNAKTAKLKDTIADIWRTSDTPDEARYRIADLLGRPVKRVFQVK